MKVIARIHCDFIEKFGIPRQSGLVPETRARIVFEPEYRNPDALRGIETYSHLWLIWSFSKAQRDTWSPTVRPPRLEVILSSPDGPVLVVGGADLLDGTPIYDIKPYLPYVDSHPDARGGFTENTADYALAVVFPDDLLARVDSNKREALRGVLAGDPRPSYQHDPARVYGVRYAQYNVKFTVDGDVLRVTEIIKE